MRANPTRRVAAWLTVQAALVAALLTGAPAAAQLDPSWTVTVNGQNVQVNPDGTFRIPNVSAADQFGPGGPGTRPDFLSDDFLRLTGVSTAGGVTRYLFSQPFQIRQGQQFVVTGLTFTTSAPPPVPAAIRLSAASPVVQVDESEQLTVTATLANGSQQDVTPRASWTVYRTSNPGIATVDEDGLLTGHAAGVAFVTAVNEGATAVLQVTVADDTLETTVEGFVQLEDGQPVEGAVVSTPFGVSTTTNANGLFSLPLVVPAGSSFTVAASAVVGGASYFGVSAPLTPVAGGITDAGIIALRPGAPTIIRFEGFSNTIYNAPIVRSGYRIGNPVGQEQHFHEITSTGFGLPSNGTGILLNDRNTEIFVRAAPGSSFSTFALATVDVATARNNNPAVGLRVTGLRNGAVTGTVEVPSLGTGYTVVDGTPLGTVDELRFDGIGGQGGFVLDNLSLVGFTSTLLFGPEPGDEGEGTDGPQGAAINADGEPLP